VESRDLGLLIAAIGLAAFVIGLAMAWGLLGWFGRLPGDIRIEGESVKVYVPVASMILVSVALTLALALARRIF
jgi:hypothetical protein